MKKRILSSVIIALTIGSGSVLYSSVPVLADENVQVIYKNYRELPDPTNPDNPDWILQVPVSIEFTNEQTEVDASVKLVKRGGKDLPLNGVKVEVQSLNAYKLMFKTDQVAYSLGYDGIMSGIEKNEIGILKEGDTDKSGIAKLLGRGKKVGDYTDTLTYYATEVPLVTN